MPAELAYDIEGTGTPVVFLPGLTFDRRIWRPITERLDGSVMTMPVQHPVQVRWRPELVQQLTAAERRVRRLPYRPKSLRGRA